MFQWLWSFPGQHALGNGDPGRIHHAVEPAECRDRGIDGALHFGVAGHVGADEADRVAMLLDLASTCLLVDVDDHRAATSRDHHVGRRAAQP